MKTVLCICTYRRPNGLAALLKALADIDRQTCVEVALIDSHPAHEGLDVAAALPDDYPLSVHRAACARQGISHARNAAVALALKQQPDFLAFLDDDEWPSARWLTELLRVQAMTGADAVGGPTRSVFPPGADPALRDNPYYGADLGLPDGARCQLQAAGNFLIRATLMQKLGPDYFPPAFAFSGGEDLAFFTDLAHRGARMHWAAHALVHESVPASRLEPDWLRRRVITIANSRVRVEQRMAPQWQSALHRGIKTSALGVTAAVLSIAGTLHSRTAHQAALMRWKFRGKLGAHFGIQVLREEET